MKPKLRLLPAFSVITLSLATAARSQAVWDGGTPANPNNSGNWALGTNWTADSVPDAIATQLNDVTAGTRTVTYNSVNPSITSLSLSQSTAGAVSQLTLDTAGSDITLTDASGFTMTNGSGAVGALSLQMSGGDIRLTNAGSSTVSLNSTVSLSNGSRFVISNFNTGSIYNIDGAFSMTGGGANSNPGLYVLNGVGAFNVAATATVSISDGLSVWGRASSGQTNRGQTVNNSGAVTVQNGGQLRIQAIQSFEVSDYNNSATTTLGSSSVAGQAILQMDTADGGSGGVGRFDNLSTGTLNVYGSSHIDLGDRSDAGAHAVFTNAEGGAVTFAGDTTGAGIRSTFGGTDLVYSTVSNSGSLTVTNHSSVLRGLGIISHSGGAARLDVTNNATGVITVEKTADLEIATSNSRSGAKTLAISNAGTINIGNGADNSAEGSTVNIAARGGDNTATAATVTFSNTGALQLRGTSSLQLASDSVMTSWSLGNSSTGTVTLNHNSSIGNTGTALAFTNDGVINKTGAGTASVFSSASGTASNTGTIAIQAGGINVSTALTNSGSIGGNGTLQTAGITSTGGNLSAGNSIGTLTLALVATANQIDFETPTTFTFELGSANGTAGINNDLIAFTGLGLNSADLDANVAFSNNTINFTDAGGLSQGLYTLFTFDAGNAYSGTLAIGSGLEAFSGKTLIYNTDNIQLSIIPEPSSALLIASAGLLLLRRKRSA